MTAGLMRRLQQSLDGALAENQRLRSLLDEAGVVIGVLQAAGAAAIDRLQVERKRQG